MLKSTSGKPEGPYVALPAVADRGIDAHLSENEGKAFYLWSAGTLVRLSADLAQLEGEIRKLRPEGKHELGYEGVLLNKIGDKYLLMASGRYGYELSNTYDLYYCVAGSLNGPYGPRRMAIKNAGHGNLFQDHRGRWWCTAFDHEFVTSKKRWTPWIVPITIERAGDDLVIHVITDDQNDYALAASGVSVHTPYLDRLGRQAITFSRAYCASPVCGPSRASLFSGLYPHHTGAYLNGADPWRKSAQLQAAETLPELFRRSGYFTQLRHQGGNEVPKGISIPHFVATRR